jgi:hypothetical protein
MVATAAIRRAVPVLLVAVLGGAALGQDFRRPTVVGGGETKFARVTITNQSDIAIVFDMKWDTKDNVENMVLDPRQKISTQTGFPAGPQKPVLTVRYRKGKWLGYETVRLESGHVDPRTNNPGRVYDFDVRRTNEGMIVVVTPR